MAEIGETPQPKQNGINEAVKTNVSFSIWPPAQQTRDAVVNRLIETFTGPSVLSKRYGSLPHDEAASIARLMEEEAFAFVTASASADDDGFEIVQRYSKEIGKRLIDALKSKSTSGSAPEGNDAPQSPPVGSSEENSTIENES